MNEHQLARFALTVWEVAETVPKGDYLENNSLFKDYLREYNKRVTDPMTWPQFRDALMQAWEKDWIQFQGVVGSTGKWGSFPAGYDKDDFIGIKNYEEVPTSIRERLLGEGRTKRVEHSTFFFRRLADDSKSYVKKLRTILKEDFLDDINEALFDAMVRNQIYLLRLSGDIRNKTEGLLNAVERDIAKRISTFDFGKRTQSQRDLLFLERYIRTIRGRQWEKIDELWAEEMKKLAQTEPRRMAGIVSTISPTVLELSLPSPDFAESLVKHNPFEGRVLKAWAEDIAEADIKRMMDQIRIGMVQGETGDQIARRIVGTASRGGADGVTEITRRNAQAIVRTAVNSFGHAAREGFFDQNKDLWWGERYVATLDSRTTPVCRANDGLVFEYGKGPRPPLHWNCRSIRVPLVNGEVVGYRPAKPATEKGLLRDFADENGLRRVGSRAKLPYGYKGLFDQYKRDRVRALTSRIHSATSYQEWLERQSREFQDDLLGPTRAKLFRRGNLTLDRFVDRKGSELRLDELARRHADAFRAAGLDPEDFI